VRGSSRSRPDSPPTVGICAKLADNTVSSLVGIERNRKYIERSVPMANDVVTLAANLALTLSVIVAVVFGIAQARAAARDRKERLSLQALRNFQTRDFVELMQYVNSHSFPNSRIEFEKLPAADQVILMQFAQEMETLGILVAEKYVDIDLVDKTLGSFVSSSWKKYERMFQDIRETTKDPFLGEYFQWLAELVRKRMRDQPRKPFHETMRRR